MSRRNRSAATPCGYGNWSGPWPLCRSTSTTSPPLLEYLHGAPVTKAALIQRKQDLTASHAPATFNSMLAAVNGFFAFLGWWGLAVKLLKIQKSPFCDEGKELTRRRIRPPCPGGGAA